MTAFVTMTSILSPGPKKKYVTRACDACKKRKSKCDGCEPCQRCLASNLGCAYNSDYKRGNRRRIVCSPPDKSVVEEAEELQTRSLAQSQPPLPVPDDDTSAVLESPSHVPEPANSSQGGGGTIRIDHDSGDASVHAFLQKVSGHLTQVGRGLPRNLFSKEQSGLFEEKQARTFVLPSIETAKAYFDCFFDHANTTYRYVPKAEMFELLNQVYAENENVLCEDTEMAIVLLIMGIGLMEERTVASMEEKIVWHDCITALQTEYSSHLVVSERFLQAAESRLEKTRNVFPPTLAILQAQLLKCQLEIASSQFNSAWMTLGWTIRLGQMIDIQREPTSFTPQEAHFRRSILYAMFMVDRYLAIALGRPVSMQEHDITATLHTKLDPVVGSRLGNLEAKLWVGVVCHARLSMIMGHIVTQLYPAARHTTAPTGATIAGLEKELANWLTDVPDFFHPMQDEASFLEQGFYDVAWIFRRQQRTIRAAFFFANMLIYRDSLLREFLQQAPNTPRSGQCSDHVRKCVDNAMAMIKLAAEFGADEFKYNATFWMTSHFIFCAISILLVYLALYQESDDRNMIELAVEKAMKVHRKLDNSVNIHAQKLLDESRARVEVLRSLNSPSNTVAAHGPTPDWATIQDHQGDPSSYEQPLDGNNELMGSRTVGLHEAERAAPGPYSALEQHVTDMFGTNNGLGMIIDIGFDSVTLPETFGIEGVDLFQPYS